MLVAHALSPAAPPMAAEQLARLDVAGPRYTSYPTADRFTEAFGPEQYRQALRQRAQGAVAGGAAPLSVYVHVPFCESVCYYCACNKVITKHHERAAEYLELLALDIALHARELGPRSAVSQLHLGGGTPTFLSDEELRRLMRLLATAFSLTPDAEVSIEVDPRTVSAQRLENLAQMGFNRLSLGVQDFDPDVQRAVHRLQSHDSVAGLMGAARRLGFASINLDLILGLPKQTPTSFATTLQQVLELRPDRIALYTYAHLPQRFKPQRRIHADDLPSAAQRVQMQAAAINAFLAAGYLHIGMDHFALPGDALAVAKRQGRLHRNFQGYSTQPDSDLIGLGVSSIGKIGATYSQNAKTLTEYADALHQGQFATQRGLALTRDDLLRRAVIMALMCQGRVEFESISLAHLVDARQVLATELQALLALAEQGLVRFSEQAVALTAEGWFAVRAVAMVFDRPLQADRQRERYSRIL